MIDEKTVRNIVEKIVNEKLSEKIYPGQTVETSEGFTKIKDPSGILKIAEKTGASTATISRVNRSLNYGEDGYTVVFSRMESMKDFIENEDVSGYKKNKK